MYNRYIGNTGKYYRVEDVDDIKASQVLPPQVQKSPSVIPPQPEPENEYEPQVNPDEGKPPEGVYPFPPPDKPAKKEKKKKKLTLEPEKLEQIPGNLRGLIKDHLPKSIDLGDILLVLTLLFLFIENEDDEVLLVLIILIFIWIKPLLIKDEKEEK